MVAIRETEPSPPPKTKSFNSWTQYHLRIKFENFPEISDSYTLFRVALKYFSQFVDHECICFPDESPFLTLTMLIKQQFH